MTVDPKGIDVAQLMTEHLERAEPDLLRELLRLFVQSLMSADADAACGAAFRDPGAAADQLPQRLPGPGVGHQDRHD